MSATVSPIPRPPLDLARLVGHPRYGVEVRAALGSTNAELADRARAGAPEGTVIVAEHQTSGRGRLARTWETPDRAALTLSVLLRPEELAADDWPWLPILTGVAVSRALRSAGVGADLKWPNDVLLGGRKVAGLLAERVETPAGPAAVLGMGVNVSQTAAELPIDTATSLVTAGFPLDRTDLLLAILGEIGTAYDDLVAPGGAARLRAAYTDLCDTLDREVRVELPDGRALLGRAVGIAGSGGLVVAGADGRETTVGAGDVVHVRPQ